MSDASRLRPSGRRLPRPRARATGFVIGVAVTADRRGMALVSFVWTPYDVTTLIVADQHAAALRRALVRHRPFRPRHPVDDHGRRAQLDRRGAGRGRHRHGHRRAARAAGPPRARRLRRRGAHARQRSRLRLPGAAVGDHDHRRLRPGRDQRHHRHRHLQHPGLRPRRARRRAGALAARVHPGGARRGQGRGAITRRAHPAQHRQHCCSCRRTIQFALGILAEAGALLCRARRAAADAELGPHAVRRADAHDRRALSRARSRPRHRPHRARPQPARRRPARRPRPEPAGGAR